MNRSVTERSSHEPGFLSRGNTMKDERELVQFLTSDVSYFERSTFGAMIEQLQSAAYGTRPCTDCGGHGVLDQPWKLTKDTPKGVITLDIPTGKTCPRCNGSGHLAVRIRGSGVVTARPTHSHETRAKEAPPDEILVRYARVSRRLLTMGPYLSAALMEAYGDAGEAHSGELLRGRHWAAAPLTQAGRRLLEWLREGKSKGQAKRKTGSKVKEINPWRALEALTDLAKLDASKPDKARSELLAQAASQAAELVKQAEKAWEDSR